MVKCIVVVLTLACGIAAQGITLSPDSLRIYNNPMMSGAEEFFLVNGTAGAVDLDSAFLLIDEMDTTGSGAYGGLGDRFHLQWKRAKPSRTDMWSLGVTASGAYRLTPASSSSSIRPSLYFSAPGETLSVGFVEIGTCLGCSGIPTWYPPYLRGRLRLYFDNGQLVTIRLYSYDMRKTAPAYQPCTDFTCDSINVRKILDRNGLQSVGVSEVTSIANGRIAGLNIYYHPEFSNGLPKPLTVIPQEIGNLTALVSFSAGGNTIDSISPAIGRCSRLQTFLANNNGITALPDSIIRCPLRLLSLENNRLSRLPDSIGKMKSLGELSMVNNRLASLPASMVKLDSLRCLFIAGNAICTLPDTLIAWLSSVKRKMYCERFDPTWPDSQRCAAVSVVPGDIMKNGGPAHAARIKTVDGVLIAAADATGRGIRSVELFDVTGRQVASATASGAPAGTESLRLSTRGLAAGIYYAAVICGGTVIDRCRVLVGR